MTHRSPRRYGDQMQCAHCGKSWDSNDPGPPPCEGVGEATIRRLRALFADPTNIACVTGNGVL